MTNMLEYVWVIEVFVVVLLTMFGTFLKDKYYIRLYEKLQDNGRIWDDALLVAWRRPLGLLIWTLGIAYAATHVANKSGDLDLANYILVMRRLGLIIAFAWFAIRFVGIIERRLVTPEYRRESLDSTTVHALANLSRISVFITSVLIGMELFGVPISGVLAFGGLGGIGVTFAAKDMIANFFGGLMIYLDRPFVQGDRVYSPDRDIAGTVEHIGWRLTRIRTFDKQPRFVPNGVFSTIAVDNQSRMVNRRINHTIGVRYDDASKVHAIVDDIRDMVMNHPGIDTSQYIEGSSQSVMVNFHEFAASSLNIIIYAFTKTIDWVEYRNVQQDIFLRSIAIVSKHSAECAFPTQTLHIAEQAQMPPSQPMRVTTKKKAKK